MTRNQIAIVAAAVVALLVLAGGAYYIWGGSEDQSSVVPVAQSTPQPSTTQAAAPSSGGMSQPLIAVVDHDAFLTRSKMGQDISRQISAYAAQLKKTLLVKRAAVLNDIAAFQKQQASLSPEARQKRGAALEAEQNSFQEEVQRGDAQVKATLDQANGTMAKALGPILQQLEREHGANMLLDNHAVVASNGGTVDITDEAISRLDAKMTTYSPPSAPASDDASALQFSPQQ